MRPVAVQLGTNPQFGGTLPRINYEFMTTVNGYVSERTLQDHFYSTISSFACFKRDKFSIYEEDLSPTPLSRKHTRSPLRVRFLVLMSAASILLWKPWGAGSLSGRVFSKMNKIILELTKNGVVLNSRSNRLTYGGGVPGSTRKTVSLAERGRGLRADASLDQLNIVSVWPLAVLPESFEFMAAGPGYPEGFLLMDAPKHNSAEELVSLAHDKEAWMVQMVHGHNLYTLT